MRVDENGNIPNRKYTTTPPFAPPEYHAKKEELNAEKFMAYQLGIALYDYMVMPVVSQDPEVTPWYEENPLDYNHEVFNSPKGNEINKLIGQLTEADPNKRLSLNEAHQTLAKIQRLGPKENTNLNVKSWRQKLVNPYKYAIHSGVGRDHNNQEVLGNCFKDIKEQLKSFKGDRLKSEILEQFKSDIENVESKQELNELKDKIMKSPEYSVLTTAQGNFTRVFGIKTSSEKALNKMFEEQEKFLDTKTKLTA